MITDGDKGREGKEHPAMTGQWGLACCDGVAREASLRRWDLSDGKASTQLSRVENEPAWGGHAACGEVARLYLQSPQYLDDVEAGTVLGPSSYADPDQVLSILLQGHLPRHGRDSTRKRRREVASPGGRLMGGPGEALQNP